MTQTTVGNFSIDIEHKDIKNMHLAVYPPDGRVRIAVPTNTSDEVIRLFIISKLSWIKKHQKNFNKQERQTERQYISGESHYFKGRRYLLNVILIKGVSKVKVRHSHIDLQIKENFTQQQKANVLNRFYRQHLKEVLPPIIEKYENLIGVKLNEYGIKRMKTKWGTCSIDKKRIWLNLELAKKSIQSVEYIVAHEMVHFLERHHNENFKSHLDKIMPNWKQMKQEINQLPVIYGK